MRHRADANQAEIVQAFEALGATVAITSQTGKGFPDLVVGLDGRNFLVEVKDGAKEPRKRKLSPEQEAFHSKWNGQICTIETVDEVLTFIIDRIEDGTL